MKAENNLASYLSITIVAAPSITSVKEVGLNICRYGSVCMTIVHVSIRIYLSTVVVAVAVLS